MGRCVKEKGVYLYKENITGTSKASICWAFVTSCLKAQLILDVAHKITYWYFKGRVNENLPQEVVSERSSTQAQQIKQVIMIVKKTQQLTQS